MEIIITLLVLLVLGLGIFVPLSIQAKLNNIKEQVSSLQKQILQTDNKLMFLINNMVRKEDLEHFYKLHKTAEQTTKKQADEQDVTLSANVAKRDEEKPEVVEHENIAEKEHLETNPIAAIEKDIDNTAETSMKEQTKIQQDEESAVKTPSIAAIKKEDPQISMRPTVVAHRPSASIDEQETETIEAPQKSFIERIMGDNWLSKIGIITLVIGIGFFVKYAIDQNWINEVARVGIGLITGFIIIGIAHKMKKEYHIFSSILVGGGISVFYVTITLAFREYAIFNQTVAFILLTVITIFSVIISLFYNRQELAIFSLLGGFLSPLMVTTDTGNYIALFSFLLILNAGMLIISLKKNWQLLGGIAYGLSILFFWIWLMASFQDQYTGATIFASLFFIQFYSLAIIEHYKANKKMTVYQALLILTNNLSVFFAFMFIFRSSDYDLRGLFTLIIAVTNAIILLLLFRQTRVDKNMIYLIIAIIMSFVSLAIPIQLRGHVITMFWAAETVLLLWLWQRSKINAFRFGFLVITLLTIISYLMDISHYNNSPYEGNLSIIFNHSFITGVVLIASFAVSLFLLRKEPKNDNFCINGSHIFELKDIINAFTVSLISLIFLVPFLELNYQLGVYTDVQNYNVNSFRYTSLATYICLFVAGLSFVFQKKIGYKGFIFLTCFLALYLFGYSSLAIELRKDIFLYHSYTSSSFFIVHLLSLLAIGYIYFILIKRIKTESLFSFKLSCWILVVIAVAILSIELDHLIVWMFSYGDNYDSLLKQTHNIAYPILWGLIAMILMVWGLKKKESILRQISLIFFGLIILKFYLYDVWFMSQAGLIISFVVLGIIFLIVSFLQQKIKKLMKEDELPEDETDMDL